MTISLELDDGLAIGLRDVSKTFRVAGAGGGAFPIPWRGRGVGRATGPGSAGTDADDEEDDDLDEVAPAEPPAGAKVRALKGVTLDVARGTALGVIGANASGKSTLLKLVARVTPPTGGHVLVRGRVAPLFALATSMMRDDSTGRENVFDLARLYNVPHDVAERQMDTIIRFAGLRGKEDEPAKRYSSGMYQRLAISVVFNLEPDILLSDGQLATGDRDFRQRCVRRVIQALDEGLTLVLASHEMAQIQRFCTDAVWLRDGRVAERGSPAEVIAAYEAVEHARRRPVLAAESRSRDHAEQAPAPIAPAPQSDGPVIHDIGLFTMQGLPTAVLEVCEPTLVEVGIEVHAALVSLQCVVVLTHAEAGRVRLVQPEPFAVQSAGRYAVSVLLPAGSVCDGAWRARAGMWWYRDGERIAIRGASTTSFEAHDPRDADDADEEEEHTATDDDRGRIALSDLAWDITPTARVRQ